MIERIVEWAVDRRGWVVGTFLILAAIAVVVGSRLRFDALPDVTGKQVIVLTRAPGLTPEEVEQLVTRPIEAALGGVPGLSSQRSISRYGISSVTALFRDEADLYRARQVVQERLNTLSGSLPDTIEPPELGPLTGGLGEIFHFTLSSPQLSPAELFELAELQIAPLLRAVDGVVEVNTWGGARRTLDVVADPGRMVRRKITLAELIQAVSEATGNAPGASLPAGPGQALLRGISWPRNPADLAAQVVPHASRDSTEIVRIGDVADVVEGALPAIGAATANGQGETVYVMVQMLLGANALEVMRHVHEAMPKVRATLPPHVQLTEVYDRSDLVHATLLTVAKNLLEGGLLVVAVLFAMLGSLRAGLLVASVIPLSMLGAVAGMVVLDVPGNLMSLGALDFGLLVDGAVVMVESIFHYLNDSNAADSSPRERIRTITASVARPVFYSVLIISLVYVPILSLTGVEGTMFRPMALTVVFALLWALVLALTFIPAAASLLLGPKKIPAQEPTLVRLMSAGYRPILDSAVRHPLLVALGAASLLAVGVFLFQRAGSAFVPQLDEGDLVIQTTRAPDISLESAVTEAGRLETLVARAVPEVTQVISRVGSPAVATDVMGLEQADVFVGIAPREQWRQGLTRERLIAEIESAVAGKAGASLAFTQPIQMRFNELLGGEVSDVSLSIYGEDLERLRTLAERASAAIGNVEGAADVRISSPPAVQLIEIRPRPLDAARYGMTSDDVLDVVRALRAGVQVDAVYEGRLRIPLRVRLGDVPSAFAIESVRVPTEAGTLVPLSSLARLEYVDAPARISHEQAQRRIVVGFNVRGRDLGSVVQEAQSRFSAEVKLPSGYRAEWGGQFENLQRARARLTVVIPLVLIGIVGILFFVFDRLRPALIIFLNVPFAAVGGMMALALRGLPVSISAAIGFIALSGIAVLNGVVLVTHITEAERSLPVATAAREAALSRLRPVLMTALVAALGFVPMMLAEGVGAEVQRPLATVVVGGLITSTVLTLVILPSLYPWIGGKLGGAS